MDLTFEYWYFLPLAIIIASIAMSSGIGGAVFFAPILMLALKLDPVVAVGISLAIELFGFGSGLFAYVKSKLIDYQLGFNLLIFSVPMAILGTIYADLIPPVILKTIFATGLVFIGTQLYTSWRKEEKEKLNKDIHKESEHQFYSMLTDDQGRIYKYTVCNKNLGRAFAAIGGAFLGMLSVGLAELQEYHLVAKCKVPSPVAIATSIFVVVITVLTASIGHFYEFFTHSDAEVLSQVVNINMFAIPGVVIGGQIGPRLQKYLPADVMKVGVSALFVLVGIFMLLSLII